MRFWRCKSPPSDVRQVSWSTLIFLDQIFKMNRKGCGVLNGVRSSVWTVSEVCGKAAEFDRGRAEGARGGGGGGGGGGTHRADRVRGERWKSLAQCLLLSKEFKEPSAVPHSQGFWGETHFFSPQKDFRPDILKKGNISIRVLMGTNKNPRII